MSNDPLILLEGVAAVLLRPSINTDIIAPPARAGLPDRFGPAGDGARRLFGPWRYDEAGAPRRDFVLNRAPFDTARFLIAGPNFACGSSRETAASWLRAFGIRCVIAASFGGIFFDNCFRNGILPLQLGDDAVDLLAPLADAGKQVRLDVTTGTLAVGGVHIDFELPAFRRKLLVEACDEVAVTLGDASKIKAFQDRLRIHRPWIFPNEAGDAWDRDLS